MKPEHRKLLNMMPLGRTMSAIEIVRAGGATTPHSAGVMCRSLPEFVHSVVGPQGRTVYTRYREPPQPIQRDHIRVALIPHTPSTGSSTGPTHVPVSLPREPWMQAGA